MRFGIGISSFTRWGDIVVKFPSLIHKVKFSAQQVTKEMQGIEVSGMIVWSIFREDDGPIRAFKYLGQDITQANPKTADDNLIEMTNGIVRHKIANSTINEILRNRHIIRDDLKRELNKNVNGWGVWLETVEITDVVIKSQPLFENLQTEFREAQRQKSEILKMKTENLLKEKRLALNSKIANVQAEFETKK